jgi:hypothetical protein
MACLIQSHCIRVEQPLYLPGLQKLEKQLEDFIELVLLASVWDSRQFGAQLSCFGFATCRDNEPVAMAHLATKEEGSGLVAGVPQAPKRTKIGV